MPTAPKVRVLFVCTGNICRSPTAEGVLRHKLKAAGLDKTVEVTSAGTQGWVGEPPDARAIDRASARGYDLSRQRGRQLSRSDLRRHDYVLAMDDSHVEVLQDLAPEDGSARVSLFLVHSARHAALREVPDPYYGPAAGFDRVLDLVEDACDGFVRMLLREHGTSLLKG